MKKIRIERGDNLEIIPDKYLVKTLKKFLKKYQWFTFDFLTGNIEEAVTPKGKYLKAIVGL